MAASISPTHFTRSLIGFATPRRGLVGQNVYFMAPDRKTITRVTTDLNEPNGIIGTPDGKVLYVADPGAANDLGLRHPA